MVSVKLVSDVYKRQVELIMSLEEEFEISISDEDAARFHDMPGLIAYIAEKIS